MDRANQHLLHIEAQHIFPYALKEMGSKFIGHLLAGPLMAATGRAYRARGLLNRGE